MHFLLKIDGFFTYFISALWGWGIFQGGWRGRQGFFQGWWRGVHALFKVWFCRRSAFFAQTTNNLHRLLNTNAKGWHVIHGLFLAFIFGLFLFFRVFWSKTCHGGAKNFSRSKEGGLALFEAPRRGGHGKNIEDGICFAKIKRIKQSIVKARQRVKWKNYICPRHD